MKDFKDFGFSEGILKAIEEKGFEEPTPIQEKIIPDMLNSECDLIAQAQTGTGKTAAFGLPILERLNVDNSCIQALVLCPTRELAIQVSEELNSLRSNKDIHITPIYGGQSIDQQIQRLKRGVHIVVGTPGRVIDHLRRRTMKLGGIKYLILDEADEMLAMGFIEDVETIMAKTNTDKRTLLFSATIPQRIASLAKKYMKDQKLIRIQPNQITTELADQIYFEVNTSDRLEALCRIIDVEEGFYGLIFCRTKINVNSLTMKLQDRGYDTDCLHGDISQHLREKILKKFKDRHINILVATDVAARGLDIYDLTHVINYSLPQDPDSYIHRIGRTGRAGKLGTAITFISPSEYRKLVYIKKHIRTDIRKEELPGINQILQVKQDNIKKSINEIMKAGEYKNYINLAKELLQQAQPEETVASVLEFALKGKLDKKQYSTMTPASVDNKGTTRLFIAKGKKDGFTPRELIKFIQQKASIQNNEMQNIGIFDSFSFVTVPFQKAEIILKSFRNKKKNEWSLVVKAKHERIKPKRSSRPRKKGKRNK